MKMYITSIIYIGENETNSTKRDTLPVMADSQTDIFYIDKPKAEPASLPLGSLYQQRKRNPYRVKYQDTRATRYECICGNRYLSYTALYHHVKKHHKEFLEKNRHFAANNSIIIIDQKLGIKIRKILLQKVQFKSIQDMEKQKLRGEQLRKIRITQREIEQKYKNEFQQKNVIARQRLSQINLDNQELDRRIQITKRKIAKNKQITQEMHEIIGNYEKILAILKITDIIAYFNQREYQKGQQ